MWPLKPDGKVQLHLGYVVVVIPDRLSPNDARKRGKKTGRQGCFLNTSNFVTGNASYRQIRRREIEVPSPFLSPPISKCLHLRSCIFGSVRYLGIGIIKTGGKLKKEQQS